VRKMQEAIFWMISSYPFFCLLFSEYMLSYLVEFGDSIDASDILSLMFKLLI